MSLALRCNVEEGIEYSPDRLLSGVNILEIVGKFKRVSAKQLMPDLDTIKDTYSCIFNIIRLGTRHKKTYWMSETQFSCRGLNKELLVYR